jgi:hypothetical protein
MCPHQYDGGEPFSASKGGGKYCALLIYLIGYTSEDS